MIPRVSCENDSVVLDLTSPLPPSTNQLCGPRRRFVSGTNNREHVNVIKNTSLQALLPLDGYSVRGVSPNQRNRDTCPHNGPELSAHPSRSVGQPDHPSPLPHPDSKRSARNQNPQRSFIFSFNDINLTTAGDLHHDPKWVCVRHRETD